MQLTEEVITLDWTQTQHLVNEVLLRNLQEGLVDGSAAMKVVPMLATRWDVIEGGKKFVFHLKPGVKWSDGVPLKAQHFVDAWKRLLSPSNTGAQSFRFFEVVGAEDFHAGKLTDWDAVGIRASDDLTLEVKLVAARPAWIWTPSSPLAFPVRKDLIDQHGSDWTRPGRMVSLGPYVLKGHTQDQNYVMERNPHYHGAKPAYERVEFVIRNDEQALREIAAGTLDLACRALSLSVRRDPQAKPYLRLIKPFVTKRLEFNLSRYAVQSQKTREAIAAAISREALAREMGPSFVPAGTLVPPVVESYDRASGVPYDPARGRKLALYGTELTILVPIFDGASEENLAVAKFIRDALQKNLGIKVKLEAPNTYASYVLQKDARSYDMIARDWAAMSDDPDGYYSRYTGSMGQDFGFANAAYDQLVQSARSERDPVKRARLYREADRIITRDAVLTVPLYYKADSVLVGPRAKGFEPNPIRMCDLTRIRP